MDTPNNQPIVCGTDFSEPARHAANVAIAVAKRIGTRVVLVHGVDERGEIPEHYWSFLMDEERPPLSREVERLREMGVDIHHALVGGVPEHGVAKYAAKVDAQLIVLGASGKGALDRLVLGSAAEHIAESAAVPTLIVRDSAPLLSWARGERALKVFVGADFTPASDSALRWVAELRKIARCDITLGFVDRGPEEGPELAIYDALDLAAETPEARAKNEDDLRAKAEHWLGVQPVLLRVAPGSARIDVHLLELAREAQSDLLVIGTHQWHGLSRLRHASVSRRILHKARTNVACIPSRDVPAAANQPLPQVHRILAATDLSEHGGRAIPHAYALLRAGDVVRVLHVLKPGEDRAPILTQLRGTFPREATDRGICSEVEVSEDRDTARGICEAADRFDADLICIGSHGRSGLLGAAMGSVAHDVIARSSRPVLVVRPPSF